MPDALSERVMNALKADPRTLDLRALAPHFYNLSERILELFEEEEMVDVLSDVCGPSHLIDRDIGVDSLQTFKKRAAEIADHAHNSRGAVGDGIDFLRGLDETERQCRLSLLPKYEDTTNNAAYKYSARPMTGLRKCAFGLGRRNGNNRVQIGL